MKNNSGKENSLPTSEKKKASLTSALAGGAFGFVIGTVFLLIGIVEIHPAVFLGGLTLLTSGVSGVSGLGGAVLDDILKKWGMESPALRSLINFLIMAVLTFGTTIFLVNRFGLAQGAPQLKQYAIPGMFLGLVFGILVAVISYRNWQIQQKVDLLEMENRYLAELAEKDQLLQEASRNLAVAKERNSMARELHDSISQGIHGIGYSIHSLRRQLGDNSQTEEVIVHLEQTTQATLKELRRLIMELTPSPLDSTSLTDALQLHCDLFSRRQQITLELQLNYEGSLTPEQEVAAYRILQEALANIQKHANADYVAISLLEDKNETSLRIEDNGHGFNPETVIKGNGLDNMATRARQNNASFKIESHPGSGTIIEVNFTTIYH